LTTPGEILGELESEESALDELLVPLGEAAWDCSTPAIGWTVRDQVSHLAFSEELAALASRDGERFAARLAGLLSDVSQAEREPHERGREMPPAELLGWWRTQRNMTLVELRARDRGSRVPWVVGDMSVVSFAGARLMETWAHGQDIVDGLGVRRAPTQRLRHVAHLGVQTRGFSYRISGRSVPETTVRVELAAPEGGLWSWGPEDAPDRVTGSALDFCLVVTKRRHLADTALVATGPTAREWLSIAQAFAGPPSAGRRPGQFPDSSVD